MAMTRGDYERFFREADKDHCGTLSVDELVNALLERNPNLNKCKLEKYFTTMDLSGDQQVSLDEYMKAMGFVPISKKEYFESVFNEFDKDGSGILDRDEIRDAIGRMDLTEAELDRLVELMDESKDKKVDKREFIKKVFSVDI